MVVNTLHHGRQIYGNKSTSIVRWGEGGTLKELKRPLKHVIPLCSYIAYMCTIYKILILKKGTAIFVYL